MDNSIQQILNKVTDMQLIDVISKAEQWTHEKVYKTAHSQVKVQGVPWESFNKSLQPGSGGELPDPVRFELVRAFEVHMNSGTLPMSQPTSKSDTLRLMFFPENKWMRWIMWFWIAYFVVTILF